MEPGKSVRAAPGQMGPGGASTSPINLRGGLDAPRTLVKKRTDNGALSLLSHAAPMEKEQGPPSEAEAREKVKEAEQKKLEALMEQLKEAVSKSQALEPFKDQLLLDITPEGIRIQIVDAQNRPMFDVGSARLRDYTGNILHELAPYLSSVPNRISITGHTDIRPYPGQGGYSNWELSADRANAARRSLVSAGLPDDKIARVVGLASSVLFDRADPQNPINRRISIVIMTKQAEEDALKTDTEASPSVAPPGIAAAAPRQTVTSLSGITNSAATVTEPATPLAAGTPAAAAAPAAASTAAPAAAKPTAAAATQPAKAPASGTPAIAPAQTVLNAVHAALAKPSH